MFGMWLLDNRAICFLALSMFTWQQLCCHILIKNSVHFFYIVTASVLFCSSLLLIGLILACKLLRTLKLPFFPVFSNETVQSN